VRHFGLKLLDTLLPPLCLTCRAPVAQWGGLCATCFGELQFIEPPFCEKLSIPFDYETEETISQEAKDFPPPFTSARSVLLFNPMARKLVHGVKYHDRLELIEMLSSWMQRSGQEMLKKSDMLIPVPLHWTKLFTRKFNQAGELARALAQKTKKPFRPHTLKRIKRTPSQTGLSRFERAKNMQSAFAIKNEADIKNKVIVLVDDVLTTGATLYACTNALLKGGAKEVHVLTLARVLIGNDE
jgi:ComF family protein